MWRHLFTRFMDVSIKMNAHAVVLDILHKAVSQDATILKPAEEKLQTWETEPGFYLILKDVFCDYTIDVNVRLLSVLYFKNGVEKYWRSNAPNAISESEKTSVRQSLHYFINEPVKMMATHLAVLIAKIARFDCPKQWPELIPELLKGMKSGDIPQNRSLLIMHQVVKSLSSKRLSVDRKMFQDLTAYIYPQIYEAWEGNCQTFFKTVQENKDEAGKCLESALLSLKILEKLTVRGFVNPHECELVDTFLKVLIERAKMMLQIRLSMKSALEEYTTKYVVRSNNVLQNLLDYNPLSFADYIPFVLEYVVIFAFTPEGEQYLFERFLLQCFNLIKTIILCPEFKLSRRKHRDGIKEEPRTLTAQHHKQTFFTNNTLIEICRKLITHYFLLTPQDIDLWATDPEAYAVDESGETWKYSLRPSLESLFAALFNEYRAVLAPLVVELVRQNEGIASPDDIQAILIKDAIYNAVGIAAFDLYDEVDFNNWLTTTLDKEIKVLNDNYRILRRRIAWLIGNWTGVKLSSSLHPMVYSIMISLLKPEEDMVVRLTAANTIRILIDVFDFNIETFLEYLEPIFFSLFSLLKEAQQCDTKLRVLHILYFIIERVGIHVEPYYNNLVQYLPILWQESEPHNMLRCAVVTTLVYLVKALGKINNSEEVYNFVLSVISLSTDINQKCHVYLLEDGLQLWQAVIENAPQPNPAIMQLFKNLPIIFVTNFELMPSYISLISAYVLLSPNELLQVYGEKLIYLLKDVMTDLRVEGMILILGLLELFIKVNSPVSCNLIKPLLPKIFEHVCRTNDSPKVMSLYLSILARVLLESKDIFGEVLDQVSSAALQSKDEVLNGFINVWLDKMPLVSKLERKKLLGLALSSLLPTDPRFVYNQFCGILLAVTEVLNDVTRPEENGSHVDALFYYDNDSIHSDDSGTYETEHDCRKKQLALRDPVHTVNLEEFFKSQIYELKKNVGQLQFQQFVQTVDAETLAQASMFVVL